MSIYVLLLFTSIRDVYEASLLLSPRSSIFSLSLSSSFTTLALFDVILDKSMANICEHFFFIIHSSTCARGAFFLFPLFFLHLSLWKTQRLVVVDFFSAPSSIYIKSNRTQGYSTRMEMSSRFFFLLCFYRSSYFKHDIRKRIMFIYIEIRRSSLENCNNGRETSRISYH